MKNKKQSYYCMGIIIIAILIAYCNTVNAPFIFDDIFLIEEIGQKSAFQLMLPYSGLRPFYKVSFALNYYISTLQPWSYHLINILIHICNALLIFSIIKYTLSLKQFQNKFHRSGIWISFFTALIWGIHPLQTQAVTYISQRCEIMMAMFYLLALFALIKSNENEASCKSSDTTVVPGSKQGSKLNYRNKKYNYLWQILVVLFFLIGVGSKEAMISAPLVLFLYDRIFLSTSIKETFKKHYIVYYGMAVVIISPLIYLLIVGRLFHYVEDISGSNIINSYYYLLTQSEIVIHYIKLSIIPYPLCFDYNWQIKSSFTEVLVPIIICFISFSFLVGLIKKNIFLAFPLLFFAINLIPRSSIIVSPHLAIEYRMYLPLVGLLLFYLIGFFLLLENNFKNYNQKTDFQRLFYPILITIYCFMLLFITIRENNLYNRPLKLWERNVYQSPNNFNALNYYGIELTKENQFFKAKICFEKALKLQPNHLVVLNNLANVYFQMGNSQKAISLYYRSLETHNKDKELLNKFNQITNHNLAKIFAHHKDYPKAIFHYKKAISLAPNNTILINELNYCTQQTKK